MPDDREEDARYGWCSGFPKFKDTPPNEVRELDYEIPVDDKIAIIRAEGLYDLLLPPLKHKMKGKLPDELMQSKVAASVEVRI